MIKKIKKFIKILLKKNAQRILAILCVCSLFFSECAFITAFAADYCYVAFKIDGETKTTAMVEKGGYLDPIQIYSPPQKDGEAFFGWTVVENERPGVIQDLANFKITQDITLYAYYDPIFDPYDNTQIYYSDIFWEYPKILKSNLYLTSYNYNTFAASNHVINEYIETPDFIASAIEHGISTALSPTQIIKDLSDKIGLSNFEYNEELDNANQIFAEAICDVNLSVTDATKENKYVKNINKFLKTAQTLDKIALEEEAYYKGLGKAEVYDYFIDQSFAMLKSYCTELEPKLPSLKSRIYTALNETTEVLGTATDAIDFAKAVSLSIVMQETQLELIQDIIDTQPAGTTLYNGMVRLKRQLEGGFLIYFTETYLFSEGFDLVAGKVGDIVEGAILGQWGGYAGAVKAVVGVLNTVVFDFIWKVDYSEYLSACFLLDYADGMHLSLVNKADVFGGQVSADEIDEYTTLFDAYVAMTKASLEGAKSLAKYNKTYTTTYVDAAISNYCNDKIYDEFVEQTKIQLKAFTPSVRETFKADPYDIHIPKGTTYKIHKPSDTLEANTVYVRDTFGGKIVMEASSTLDFTNKFKLKQLEVNGTLKSTNSGSLTCDIMKVSGTSSISIPVTCNGVLSQSSGTLNLSNDVLCLGDVSLSGTTTQSSDKTFSANGDLTVNGYSSSLGNLVLGGKLSQKVSGTFTVNDFTNNNTSTSGVTINNTVTVNGKARSSGNISGGQNLVLTSTASLPDDTFYGDVTINGLTGELPSRIHGTVYLNGDISQSNDVKCNSLVMKSGTLSVTDSNVTLMGVYELNGGTLNLANSSFTVNGLFKSSSSGGTITADCTSTFTANKDAYPKATITGDGNFVFCSDLNNGGTINVGKLTLNSKLANVVSGNNINTRVLELNATKPLTINNKIYVSEHVTGTGDVVNEENIIVSTKTITKDTTYNTPITIDGGLVIDGKKVVANKGLTVKNGSIALLNGATLEINGVASLTGGSSYNITVDDTSKLHFKKIAIVSSFSSITNDGTLIFDGDTSLSSLTLKGNGNLSFKNDLFSSSLTINCGGSVDFNGKLRQSISANSAKFGTINISNSSKAGVIFGSTVYYTVSYNQNENKVTGTVKKG